MTLISNRTAIILFQAQIEFLKKKINRIILQLGARSLLCKFIPNRVCRIVNYHYVIYMNIEGNSIVGCFTWSISSADSMYR